MSTQSASFALVVILVLWQFTCCFTVTVCSRSTVVHVHVVLRLHTVSPHIWVHFRANATTPFVLRPASVPFSVQTEMNNVSCGCAVPSFNPHCCDLNFAVVPCQSPVQTTHAFGFGYKQSFVCATDFMVRANEWSTDVTHRNNFSSSDTRNIGTRRPKGNKRSADIPHLANKSANFPSREYQQLSCHATVKWLRAVSNAGQLHW